MEPFTAACLGFFWGIVFTEIIEKLKKRIELKNQNKNNSD
tara:strand:+ start:5202 stop:5321 length:120 start_codon:yes stop_codon:yes gene_type:complete